MRVNNRDLFWRRLGDEVILLDQRTSLYLGINSTGAALWDLLVDGCDRDQLVSRLVDTAGASPETAGREVDDFLGSLREQALLDETGDTPESPR